MIIKKFQKGDAISEATYSKCEKYRYCLSREWDDTKKRVHYIMLNPSTATSIRMTLLWKDAKAVHGHSDMAHFLLPIFLPGEKQTQEKWKRSVIQ